MPKINKEKSKDHTCNRLDLKTLGSQLITVFSRLSTHPG